MFLVIFYMTVFSRSSGEHEIILIPLYSLYEARRQPEIYRQMLMNVFLFEPFGLTLPYGLSWIELKILCHKEQRESDDIWIQSSRLDRLQIVKPSIFISLLCSIVIEICQGIFRRGKVEIDDVIMNLLGAMIGIVTYMVCGFIKI